VAYSKANEHRLFIKRVQSESEHLHIAIDAKTFRHIVRVLQRVCKRGMLCVFAATTPTAGADNKANGFFRKKILVSKALSPLMKLRGRMIVSNWKRV
jgi:hypothetical protein